MDTGKKFKIIFNYGLKQYEGWATPSHFLNADGIPKSWRIVLNDEYIGNISWAGDKWCMDTNKSQPLINAIGDFIFAYIE